MKDKKSLETKDLFQLLSESKHMDEFLQKNEDELLVINLHTHLYKLLEEAGFTIPLIVEQACISKSLAYQIFNGQRAPNRNVLIRISIVLRLELEETQRLLRIAKKGELYPRIQRDAAIIFCIQHGLTLSDANELLEDLNEAILLKEE